MEDRFEKCAAEWLKSVRERPACSWCRNTQKRIYHLGMCRSCYRIRLELRRLHKRVVEISAKLGENWAEAPRLPPKLISLEADYITAIHMVESAQVLGRVFEGFLDEASTLQCEHQFRVLSKRFVRKDLFSHCAFLFSCFSPVHRQYLMYLIGIIMQEFYSRNRRKIAASSVLQVNGIKEALENRAWGTYRVEDDVPAKAKK